MSRSAQLFVLFAFLLGGVVLALIGYDMATHPSVYPINRTFIQVLGYFFMAVAFIPSIALGVYVYRNKPEPAPVVIDIFNPPKKAAPKSEPVIPAVEPAPRRGMSVESIKKGGDQSILGGRNHPHLIGLTGGLPNRVEVPHGVFMIGRAPDCHLPLTSQLVSRHHAQLEWNGEILMLRDLGSSNATLVNDKKVDKEVVLNEGDVIQIVDYSLEVELPPSLAKTIIRREPGEPEIDPNATLRMPGAEN